MFCLFICLSIGTWAVSTFFLPDVISVAMNMGIQIFRSLLLILPFKFFKIHQYTLKIDQKKIYQNVIFLGDKIVEDCACVCSVSYNSSAF